MNTKILMVLMAFLLLISFSFAADINMGPTTITGFDTYGTYISGSGSVIGGSISVADANNIFGPNFALFADDSNDYQDIATNGDGTSVYVVTGDGRIFIDHNNGNNWFEGPFAGTNNPRYGIAASDINGIVVAMSDGGEIDISYDSGTTWATVDSNSTWHDVAISYNGQYIAASTVSPGGTTGIIRVSSDWGANWATTWNSYAVYSLSMTANGKNLIAGMGTNRYIYKSDDYGSNFVQSNTVSGTWVGASFAKLGNYAYITNYNTNKGYYTDNNGGSWTEINATLTSASRNVGSSSDGSRVIFPMETVAADNKIFVSTDSSSTYYDYTYTGKFTSAAISDGVYAYIASTTGEIYRSQDVIPGINTESCQYTDDNGIVWNSAEWNDSYERCEQLDVLINTDQSYIFNFRAQDTNGIYAYGTATKEYTGTVGTVIQFIIKDNTGTPVPNVDLNIYTVSGGVRTYLLSSTSDSTGSAYAILDTGTEHSVDVYYNGGFLSTEQVLIASASPIYITLNILTGGINLPDVNQIYVRWNPSTDFIFSDTTTIYQTITSVNVSDYNIRVYQYNNDLNSDQNTNYSAAGACAKNCTIPTTMTQVNVLNSRPFFVDLNLGLDDGNYYLVTHKYVRPYNSTGVSIQELTRLARADFSCSVDPSLPCGPTSIISIVLTIVLIGGIVLKTGYNNGPGIAVLVLALLAVFTYLSWLYWMIFFLAAAVTVIYIGKGVME